MGARLRVFLTSEQDKTLFNLRSANVPQKVKDRAEVIRLNARYVEKIAAHFNWTSQWEKLGLEGLWEKHGRGEKYQESDIVFLEEYLKKEVHITVFN